MSDLSSRKISGFFIVCIVLAATLTIAGCTGVSSNDTPPNSAVGGEIIAFTAASLTGTSADLGKAFEAANPGTKVTFNLQGTQSLKKQIELGAYGDVFISAATRYTNELMEGGYLVNDTVKELTSNYIVIIVPSKNPGDISSPADLARPGLKIAMGTAEVPIGINTRMVIDKITNSSTVPTGWKEGVFENVVTYENAEPGVVTKVSLGEADAGFVYESSYRAAKAGSLELISIPEEYNALQIYTVGILSDSENKETAQEFINFLLSTKGQGILRDFGFTPVS